MDTSTQLTFACDPASAPGFDNEAAISLRRLALQRAGVRVMSPSLGRPAARDGLVLIGTDDPAVKEHQLFYVASATMLESITANPILSITSMQEVTDQANVRDVRWLSATAAVCATGEGHLQLFSIRSDHQLDRQQPFSDVHSQPIREVAVKERDGGVIATGGFDGCVCITDVHDGGAHVLKKATLDQVVSSVKWPELNSNVCVSCTTDAGMYSLFDTRCDLQQAAVQTDLGKKDLFTHCRVSDHLVLMGYGDGEMKQLDMRKPTQCVSAVSDPYVEGIGSIEHDAASGFTVVSGYTDCSVWKTVAGQTTFWSHMSSGTNPLINVDGYTTSGVLLSDPKTIVSDSAGILHIFMQNSPA